MRNRHHSVSSNAPDAQEPSWLVNADRRHLLPKEIQQRPHGFQTPLRGSGSVVGPRSAIVAARLQSQNSVKQKQHLMLSPVLKNQLPGIDPSHQELKAGPLPENHQHLLSLLKFQRVHEKEMRLIDRLEKN